MPLAGCQVTTIVDLTIISALESLMPYGGNPLVGNEKAYQISKNNRGIKFWTVVDPRKPETYKQADDFLKTDQCMGIKIHPTLHDYSILNYGNDIFNFAEARGTIVLTHSGCSTNPEDVLLFAKKYSRAKIILAHLGSSEDGKLSRQIYAFHQAQSKMFI